MRLVVAVLSLAFIGWKVYAQFSANYTPVACRPAIVPLLAAVALMPLNWLLETHKWQVLTSHLQPLNVGTSLKSVLAGLAVSMLTPNRVGDFAGRIAWLKPENRTAGTMSAFVGSCAQMIAIALLGTLAFCLQPVLPDFLDFFARNFTITAAVLVVLVITACGIYFFIGVVAARFQFDRWPWLERFVQAAGQHTKQQLFTALVLSICRSIVFIFQLHLMLQSMGIDLAATDTFRSIALMYCFVSVVPTYALAEWGVRGSMALLFIAPLGGLPTQIVAATMILWFINVAAPAAAGAVLFVLPETKISRLN